MRVTHVTTSSVGGAGIAARRLNDALNSIGVHSSLFSGSKFESRSGDSVINIEKSAVDSLKSKVITFGQQKLVQKGADLVTLFSISTCSLDEILQTKPDIIHLHSYYNLLSGSDIEKLIQTNLPIFITLHDERVLTGGCHCTNGCINFQKSCLNCPQTRKVFHKSIAQNHMKWRKLLSQKAITLVAPSEWMASQVRASGLGLAGRLVHVRNPVPDHAKNFEFEEIPSRATSEYIITFVSHNLMNSYKGIENILNCISQHSSEFRKANIRFKFVGNGPKLQIKNVDFDQLPLLDEDELFEIFKATDLLLVPSKSDNSPNIIFEAALFGTPFLGSNRTGLPELANMFNLPIFDFGNSASLFEAIMTIKNQLITRKKIRSIALENVSPALIALKMQNLYQEKLIEVSETRVAKES